jgi:hypothetical protein
VTAAHEDRILDALKAAPKDGLSGAELAKATGLWSDPLYVALARMEHDGRLRSEWVNDPLPGRRLTTTVRSCRSGWRSLRVALR